MQLKEALRPTTPTYKLEMGGRPRRWAEETRDGRRWRKRGSWERRKREKREIAESREVQ